MDTAIATPRRVLVEFDVHDAMEALSSVIVRRELLLAHQARANNEWLAEALGRNGSAEAALRRALGVPLVDLADGDHFAYPQEAPLRPSFRPCERCGMSPARHNGNRADSVGHEYQ